MSTPIRTAILGASGYTGAELLRLLQGHPRFKIMALTGDSQAGKPMAQVYPHLRAQSLPPLVKHTEVDFSQIDFVFCCLPHGTTQSIIAGLPAHVKIVDLSADFRLFDPAAYKQWYGHDHAATELQQTAVYGLTEHARAAVKTARLVANPGCYPTSILLPLLPLFRAALVQPDTVTVDSMSGVSGAGRSVKQEMLYNEIEGGASAYSIGAHRHMAEIEQELEKVVREPGEPAMSPRSGAQASPVGDLPKPLKISFTPHLVPFTRGMLSTIHVQLADGRTADDARACLQQAYANEPFVQVLASGSPRTHEVRGTNQCFMSVHAGRRTGELIIVSVIDNLVKGASGQALQNANLMIGEPEATNLELTAVFP